MITSIQKFLMAIVIMVAITSVSSCKKDKFDEPPANTTDPNLTVTKTIAELKALYTTPGAYITLTDDDVIAGVVVADDKSGNFFNQIMIDDGTAGIAIAINRDDIYTNYPVGRKVYVKLKGLLLGDNKGLVELAGSTSIDAGTGALTLNEISSSLLEKYLVKGPLNQPVPVFDVTLRGLTNADSSKFFQSRLIRISHAEFKNTDVSLPYADDNSASVSRTLTECSSSATAAVHSSGSSYSYIGAALTPTGNGTFVAILSKYISDQLVIRDTADVQLTDTIRCVPIIVYNPISLADLRAKFTGSNTPVDQDVLVTAVVISSIVDSNNLAQNLTIQDGTAGIVVRLTSSSPNFNKGDQVKIKIGASDVLQRFSNGSMQIGTIQNVKLTRIATGVAVTPQVVTISDLIANFNDYESELVQLNGVTISNTSGLYSGTITFTDGTGSIASFVRASNQVPSAEFVNQAYPTGTVNIVGYANLNGTTKQVILRNTSDVTP